MAKRTNPKTKLMINIETGKKADGTSILKARTLSGVNPNLTDDEALAIGNALAKLQSYPVSSISRQDVAEMSSEA